MYPAGAELVRSGRCAGLAGRAGGRGGRVEGYKSTHSGAGGWKAWLCCARTRMDTTARGWNNCALGVGVARAPALAAVHNPGSTLRSTSCTPSRRTSSKCRSRSTSACSTRTPAMVRMRCACVKRVGRVRTYAPVVAHECVAPCASVRLRLLCYATRCAELKNNSAPMQQALHQCNGGSLCSA